MPKKQHNTHTHTVEYLTEHSCSDWDCFMASKQDKKRWTNDRNARIMLKYSASKKSRRWNCLGALPWHCCCLGHILTGHGGSFIVRSWRTVLSSSLYVYLFSLRRVCIGCFVIWILLCVRSLAFYALLCILYFIFTLRWNTAARMDNLLVPCCDASLLLSFDLICGDHFFGVESIISKWFSFSSLFCLLFRLISLSSHHILSNSTVCMLFC